MFLFIAAIILFFTRPITHNQQIHRIGFDQNKNKFKANVRGEHFKTFVLKSVCHSEGGRTALLIRKLYANLFRHH